MKIIKPGHAESMLVKMRCRKCGCEFEGIDEIEIHRVTDARDGDFWSVQCPESGCTHTVTKACSIGRRGLR